MVYYKYNDMKGGAKMRKLRIYLDTSVISNLIADDAPKMMEYSLRLWDEIREGLYDVYISDLVIQR